MHLKSNNYDIKSFLKFNPLNYSIKTIIYYLRFNFFDVNNKKYFILSNINLNLQYIRYILIYSKKLTLYN
jgi:hypothetical protein